MNRIIPGELGHRARQLLKPGIVCIPAVEYIWVRAKYKIQARWGGGGRGKRCAPIRLELRRNRGKRGPADQPVTDRPAPPVLEISAGMLTSPVGPENFI